MYHCKCQLIYRTLGGPIPVLTEDRLNTCVNVCIIYITYAHTHSRLQVHNIYIYLHGMCMCFRSIC